jgi:hypothetical protein
MRVNVDQRRLHGVDLTGMATGPLSPTFALRDKILYFGLSSDAVVTAATRVSCDLGQDVMHSAGFAAASKLLDSVDSTAFDYCDIPATAPAAYAGFPAAGAQLRLMLASFDITLPPIQLPPLAQLQPHLSPLFEATWADSNGVYSRSISPFPGSGLLLASPQQLTLEIATVSTAASLLQSAGNMMRQHAPRANKPGGDIWTSAALHDLIPQAGRWALLRSLAEKQPPDSF